MDGEAAAIGDNSLQSRMSDVAAPPSRMGRLLAIRTGALICRRPSILSVVPSGCCIWLPNGQATSIETSRNCQVIELFFEQEDSQLDLGLRPRIASAVVLALMDRLQAERLDHGATQQALLLLKALTQELALAPLAELELRFPRSERLRDLASRLWSHPEDRLAIKECAKRSGLSEFRLSSGFLSETGLAFGSWRQQMYLVRATEKLCEGAPVQDVARMLGYKSTGGFIEMFKRGAGVSPGHLGSLAR